MIIDYSKIEKIKIDNYTINHSNNINILQSFEKIFLNSQKNNLDFIISGSISFLLLTGKIYRSLKDVDIIIQTKDINNWIEFFKKDYSGPDFLMDLNDKLDNLSYQKYYDKFLLGKFNICIFKDLKFNNNIEVINGDFDTDNYKLNPQNYIIELKIGNYKIKIDNPARQFKIRQMASLNKKKNIDDYLFYLKYCQL